MNCKKVHDIKQTCNNIKGTCNLILSYNPGAIARRQIQRDGSFQVATCHSDEHVRHFPPKYANRQNQAPGRQQEFTK